jgi:hypothetical protein
MEDVMYFPLSFRTSSASSRILLLSSSPHNNYKETGAKKAFTTEFQVFCGLTVDMYKLSILYIHRKFSKCALDNIARSRSHHESS